MAAHITTHHQVQQTGNNITANQATNSEHSHLHPATASTYLNQPFGHNNHMQQETTYLHPHIANSGMTSILAGNTTNPTRGTTLHRHNDDPVMATTLSQVSGIQTFTAAGSQAPSLDQGIGTTQMDRYTILMPALLPGVRCYVDASLLPDQPLMSPRAAGLGVLLVNTQVQPAQTIYIKAIMSDAHSVIMAEAAALALAATVTDLLNFNNTAFLSDCKQLVHFLNEADQEHPPDWRMKPYTQLFANCANRRQAKIYNISRTLNTTADALARPVNVPTNASFENMCSYSNHDHQCPL